MDENFLIYTKMIVENTNLSILSQIIGLILENITNLYNKEGKETIVKIADDLSDKIKDLVNEYSKKEYPPNMIALAFVIIAHQMINELMVIMTKSAEKFAEEKLDMNVNFGMRAGRIEYDE